MQGKTKPSKTEKTPQVEPLLEEIYGHITKGDFHKALDILEHNKLARRCINTALDAYNGETCLHAVCKQECSQETGSQDTISQDCSKEIGLHDPKECSYLITYILGIPGINVNVRGREGNVITPLDIAVYNGNMNLVQALVRKGAVCSRNPIHWMFEENNVEMLSFFCKRLPEDNYNFVRGRNVPESCKHSLYTAVERQSVSMVTLLIAKGVELSPKPVEISQHALGYQYETPIHKAVQLRNTELLDLLLDRYIVSIDTLTPDHLQDSPLHTAVRVGCRGSVQLLLSRGADTTLPNKQGLTAVELAQNLENCQEILKIFKKFQKKKEREESALKERPVKSSFCTLL